MKALLVSLQQLFGDCKRLDTSECSMRSSYEIITFRTFYVYDERNTQQPVRIVKKNEDYQLIVNNRHQTENEVCLIKTDKCLFTDQHKKCDCILFSKNKFFFIEISEAGSGNRGKKRKDAVEQLAATIEAIRNSNIDLSNYELKAVICFKGGEIRPTQPSLNTKRALFLEHYNIDLEEGNEIFF
jgi:hypothetical protein